MNWEIEETAAERDRRLTAHEAIRQAECIVCWAGPGEPCRHPSGEIAKIPHQARREAAIRQGLWTP